MRKKMCLRLIIRIMLSKNEKKKIIIEVFSFVYMLFLFSVLFMVIWEVLNGRRYLN